MPIVPTASDSRASVADVPDTAGGRNKTSDCAIHHPEDHPPWRKRDSVLWGIAGAIHVVGLMMPVRLFSASGRRDGTNWMWDELWCLHGDVMHAAVSIPRYWSSSYPGWIPRLVLDVIHASVLLSAQYILLFAFLCFLLDRMRPYTSTATALLIASGLGLPFYIFIQPALSGRSVLRGDLLSILNLGLWTWVLSFAIAGIACHCLHRLRNREIALARLAERTATAEMLHGLTAVPKSSSR